MSKQPEALRLADLMSKHGPVTTIERMQVDYELRRLHAEVERLSKLVPDDVARYRFILAAANDMKASRYKMLCELLGCEVTGDFDFSAAIDAAKAQKGGE